eukprot:GFUD01011424.1.p1 GENE.GFUD01011424.1~~GFUD01011424.1.p1  ORF type:complete len:1305 (-),score=340.61 GFUD01011424.1:343-4257(-)
MTSESPGPSDPKMEKSKCCNKKQTCDNIQCLQNAKNPAIRTKLFQKDFKSESTRTSKKATKVLYFSALFLSILVFKIPQISAEGFCDPLLCICSVKSANCSHRAFLNLPAGLQADLKSLDLSSNDIQSVNQTEISLYPQLQILDLSRNKISRLDGGQNYKLVRLDLSHNDISSLRRIKLSKLHAMAHLDLSYNKITSVPPKSFPVNSKLEFLNLASNSIEILESDCFHELENLEELKLNRNKLSSFPKEIFIKLQNLKILELNKNKFVEIPGLSFHGLKSVKILKLRRNSLRFLMDGAFYGLDSIEQLYLDRNEVVTVNKGWLYGLTKLKQLSLAYNNVDYVEDDGWDFCRELYELNLQGNQLEIVERNILRRLPSLKHLNLRDNLISHIDAEDTFEEVPLLEELFLDGNQLSHTIEDTAAPFKHLKLLRVLTLARNSIKSVGNQALVGLEKLEELDLSENVISTIQENPLSHLPLLTSLQLNSSSLLCDCNLRWFPEYIHLTQLRGVTAECAHPENLKDHELTGIQSDLFTCEDFPKPYILVEPETQIALRGKDLTLFCRAASTSPAPMNFVWKKDGSVLEFARCDNDNSCIKNVAHSFDGKGMEITSELRLKNLTHVDIGSYQCIVDNIYGATYSTKADITVYVYPQFVLTPRDKTAQGGSSVTLKCSATGVPQPDISWQKDSGSDFPAARERRIHVDAETNTYVIMNVKADDMGVYTCTATNLAGAITTNITLNVLEVPRFVKPMSDKLVNTGDTAVLECQASGSPRPQLVWSKDSNPLFATERHFFTADNQLLIIVKVEPSDAGQYKCQMQNQLGTVMETSLLTVKGGVKSPSDPTTGIIVIAVVCCVVGTSLVWVFIIYQTRKRASRRDWEVEGKNLQTTTTGLPLLSDPELKERNDEECSERDSGTGDSKRSYDNMENNIVDHVIHNFLSARGEGEWGVLSTDYTATSLSDLDTGISSLGESGIGGIHTLHRKGCPKLKALTPIPPPPTLNPPPDPGLVVPPSTETTTYAVDNPLYDSLPITNCDNNFDKVEEACSTVSHTPSEGTSLISPPASIISDSVAYCGRFPVQDRRSCPQCGEPLAHCPHRDTRDDVSSVSSCGQSSAPSVAVSDQPLTFNTFHPFKATNHDRQSSLKSRDLSAVAALNDAEKAPAVPLARLQVPNLNTCGKKRLSAIELPTGETYLPIEQKEMAVMNPSALERDLGLVAREYREYRGGGTLPRQGLQQEWLEASLNYSDAPSKSLARSTKDRSSRKSMFRSAKRSASDRGSSLPRRKSSGREVVVPKDEHSDVALKGKDMF